MANHPIRTFLNYSGEWLEQFFTTSQSAGPVTLTQGGSEIGAAPKASSMALVFEDPDGVYRPYLPSSPLFDQAGRNTPLLVGADMGFENFEDTVYAFTWGMAGTGVWDRSATQAHSGGWSFKSPVLVNGQQGNWQIDLPAGTTTIMFWAWVDIGAGSYLAIYNGEFDLMTTISGSTAGWRQVVVDVSGYNFVLFSYQRNDAGGTNAIYIDDLLALAGQAGQVVSWDPDPGNPGDPPITDVYAQGALGVIGGWTEPIQSAYLRQLLLTNGMIDLWTCEDPKTLGGVNAAGVILQGADTFDINPIQAIGGGYTFGANDSPAGGTGSSMQIEASGSLVGYFRTSAIEYQIGIAFKLKDVAALPNPGGAFLDSVLISWADTLGWTWWIMINHDSYSLLVTDDRGATVVYDSTLYGTGADPDRWIMMVLKATYAGGTRSYELSWVAESQSTVYINTGSFAGPAGAPTYWTAAGGYFGMAGGFIGYVYLMSDTSVPLTGGTYQNAFNGYPGERVGDRLLRLLAESAQRGVVHGDPADTELTGPQRPDTLSNLLRELRDTEGGVLVDSPGDHGAVLLRTRRSLYNQPALELTYGVNVARPFRPTLNNLNAYNLVTVSQRDGGSATAEDTTSRMGTAPPPVGIGVKKQTIDVNVYQEQRLTDLAGWWRAIGTNPEPSFEAVTVDLDANPELEGAVTACTAGDRITVAGYLPDVIDLMVVAKVDNRENQRNRKVTFTCLSYRPYAPAVYDDTSRRYNARTSLNAGYNETVTSVVTTFTDVREAWSTTSTPYDWLVAGERMTVSVMGAVTGAGPWTQTATVVRSVNGVVKTHNLGEDVRMHPDQEARYGL